MASMGVLASRSASRSACSRPFSESSGSAWPSTSGNGLSMYAASDSPCRMIRMSVAPAGGWNRVCR